MTAAAWEAELAEKGHLSQHAFSCNFASSYECAVCDPIIVVNDWHVPPLALQPVPARHVGRTDSVRTDEA